MHLKCLVCALALAPGTALSDRLWTPVGDLLQERSGSTATLLADGKVLIAGGYVLISVDAGYSPTATAELYDPTTETSTGTGSMTTARISHTATLLANGKVLVAGGTLGTETNWEGYLASAELYDPTTGTWTATGSLMVSRASASAVLLESGKVLVVGGVFCENCIGIGLQPDAELYDPTAETWSSTGPGGPMVLLGGGLTLLPSGKVLVTGGFGDLPSSNGENLLAGAELYNPSTDTWSLTGSMSIPRQGHTATVLQDGTVLIAGGGITVQGRPEDVLSAELYEPTTGLWMATGSAATWLAFQSATVLPSGRVLLAGGFSVDRAFVASAELYDPTTGIWSSTGSMLKARAPDLATLLPSGRVLVVGGSSSPLLEAYDENGGLAPVLSPITATVAPKESRIFMLLVGGGPGTLWSLDVNLSAGTLQADGVYTAGPVGNVVDEIRVTNSLGNSATATVVVSPAVYIYPSPISVAPKASQTFTAAGGSGTGYIWAFATNRSGGTLTEVGVYTVYTAGADGGVTDVVEVTDSLSATATATIAVSQAVTIYPSSVTVEPKASQTFTVTGGSGTGHTWLFATNASGGSLTQAGLYTAGPNAGVTDVVEVTDSLSATAVATVRVAASSGCGVTGGAAFPLLVLALVPLVVARQRARRSNRSASTGSGLVHLSRSVLPPLRQASCPWADSLSTAVCPVRSVRGLRHSVRTGAGRRRRP